MIRCLKTTWFCPTVHSNNHSNNVIINHGNPQAAAPGPGAAAAAAAFGPGAAAAAAAAAADGRLWLREMHIELAEKNYGDMVLNLSYPIDELLTLNGTGKIHVSFSF